MSYRVGYWSKFLKNLYSREMLYQITSVSALDDLFLNSEASSSTKICGYIGFDCTARSLHIGSLVQIMFLRWLQKFGHTPIVLIGDTTAKIGDPSGKNKSRALLSDDQVEENVIGITKILKRLLPFNDVIFARNSEWLEPHSYISFMREVGAQFSVNEMLKMETFKNRISNEQNLSFLEFSYALLQSYDFACLNKRYGCKLQIGGSDQWGNITSGVDLVRRLNRADVFGITTPLLTNARGEKMGKTVDGAVWLDEQLCSNYDFWQYFRNVHDDDVKKCLCLLTELDIETIKEISGSKGSSLNEAKKRLATEVTKICRGEEAAIEAEKMAIGYFEEGNTASLPIKAIQMGDRPEIQLIAILQLAGFANSNSEAKRLIAANGVKIDDLLITDVFHLVENSKQQFVLSVGKKKHIRIIFEF